MSKLVIRRTAADNPYLHKDFHGALSAGIEYLHQRYGEGAVRDYLRQFAAAFYAPLTQDIVTRGLIALREYLERIYTLEGGQLHAALSDDELLVEVERCPAVSYMREHGYPVARLFYETSRTVYAAICAGTPFCLAYFNYEDETGHTCMQFARRPA